LQVGYTSGDGLSHGSADQYSMMSGYYPYYATAEDMNSAMWSAGDVVSPTAISYGYNPMEYASMMANCGYAGYGWYPGTGGSGWEASVGAMKGDPSASYAAAGGFYGIGSMSAYSGSGWTNGQEQEVSSVEQNMQSMSLEESRHAGVSNKNAAGATRTTNGSSGGSKSWATVASQPSHSYAAKSRSMAMTRAPVTMANVWDGRSTAEIGRHAHDGWSASRRRPTTASSNSTNLAVNSADTTSNQSNGTELNQYNPKEFDLSPKAARFYIIKSFAEDDIHRSIKYGIWCSTEYGNKRLDAAYREREGKGPVFLFFSVNGSGHFCGIAQMTSPVDYESSAEVWQQGHRWKGQFTVKWIYVKDVPNSQLRHIRLENNEGKPVTNSRDTQEVPPEKGCQVLRVIHQYRHTTSIFDDFSHYEKSQTKRSDK